MKKLGFLFSALLMCICFILVGCTYPLEMPVGEAKSNGGNMVVVGDYIYFANTYVSASSLTTGGNDQGKVGENAIYRVKTENNKIVKNEDGYVDNLEEVMSKIAGFETSNMFVKGNYLYFTSPNIHKSSVEGEEGKDKFNLTTLFRCKLDGTGLKEILTTQTTSGKFYLAKNGEKDMLYFFDNNKIQQLEIKDNLSKAQTMVEDVEDTVFPEKFGQTLNEIFYTVALTEEDGINEGVTGNKLYKYSLASGESTPIRQKSSETITLVAYDTNRLYYTRNTGDVTYYYSNNFKQGFEAGELQHTFAGTSTDITEFYTFGTDEEGNVLPVVYVYKSKLYLQPVNANYQVIENVSVTIEFVDGENVYYTTSEGMFRVNYKNQQVKQITDKTNIKAGTADICGRYVYFYAQTDTNSTNNYYMYRADTGYSETSGKMNTECISSVLAEDLVENTETETQE